MAGADGPIARTALCPGCGYDLRGHPDDTRCPECGLTVSISATSTQINQWADRRLLDLWSAFLLQTIGAVCTAFGLLAVARGQYVALMLELPGVLYVGSGLLWYLVLLVSVVRRMRSHAFKMLRASRRRQLMSWLLLNAAPFLMAAIAVFTLGPW